MSSLNFLEMFVDSRKKEKFRVFFPLFSINTVSSSREVIQPCSSNCTFPSFTDVSYSPLCKQFPHTDSSVLCRKDIYCASLIWIPEGKHPYKPSTADSRSVCFLIVTHACSLWHGSVSRQGGRRDELCHVITHADTNTPSVTHIWTLCFSISAERAVPFREEGNWHTGETPDWIGQLYLTLPPLFHVARLDSVVTSQTKRLWGGSNKHYIFYF